MNTWSNVKYTLIMIYTNNVRIQMPDFFEAFFIQEDPKISPHKLIV